MNKKFVIIITVIIVVSILTNSYLLLTAQTRLDELNVAWSKTEALESEKAGLYEYIEEAQTTMSIVYSERDQYRADIDVLNGRINQLNSDLTWMTNDRDNLKLQADFYAHERDEARANAHLLQGENNQLHSDLSWTIDERDALKDQITDWTITISNMQSELDYMDSRIITVGHYVEDFTDYILYHGFIVNTGVHEVTGILFNIKAWDHLGQQVIDVYQGLNEQIDNPWTIQTGQYVYYNHKLQFSPYDISRYEVTLIWDE